VASRPPAGPLERGLEAFARREWGEAYTQLTLADEAAPLSPPDLERLAMAAHLTGQDAHGLDLLARAHQAFLHAGDIARAARCAFWMAFALASSGDRARGSGWAARGQRLIEGFGDSVEQGYLLLPVALGQVAAGDLDGAEASFAEAARVGERFHDPDLTTLARQGRGRVLIRRGEAARGVALLDEAMVAVTAGELSPIIAGTVYCSVISACFERFDLRRAHEWTEALDHWCAGQGGLVPYRGQCLVYRAEVMAFRGGWRDALAAAEQASRRCESSANRSLAGAAFYQLGQLHRLRGAFDEAEAAYRRASDAGRSPQPGLALLRLAQGRTDAACAAISRVAEEASEPRTRATALAASVEVFLEAGDLDRARAASDLLAELATRLDAQVPAAMAAHAGGAVRLAEGDPAAALAALRGAVRLWRDLEAPYEAARSTVLVGLACRALGDTDTGDLELDAARRAFEALDARPDLARLDRRVGAPGGAPDLTGRELQVLELVASGRTNRGIARELGISEKTVARHLSNIFVKLDLTSRAAATAYAFQHQLVPIDPGGPLHKTTHRPPRRAG